MSDDNWWKFVKFCEIEAHSLFENWQFSTNISEESLKIAKSNAQAAIAQALRASHRGGSSLGQRPATLFMYVYMLINVVYTYTYTLLVRAKRGEKIRLYDV